MKVDYKDASTEQLIQHLQELEHSYAEAFADGIDNKALSDLYKIIIEIQTEIDKRKKEKNLTGF